jgi:hypothetical protein
MDKYIYVLVGIIWLVSNIYKSFRKKEEGQNQDSSPENSPPLGKNVETILEEILTGKQQPKSAEEEYIPAKPKKKRKLLHSDEAEQKKSAKDTDLPVIQEKRANEEATFDLRDAVIYSEIMGKPKYLSDN